MTLRLITRGKKKIWYVDDRMEGLRIRDCLGTCDRAIAERRVIQIEHDVISGLYHLSQREFDQCVKIYKRDFLLNKTKSVQNNFNGIIRTHLLPFFKGKTIRDIVYCDPISGENEIKKFFEIHSEKPEGTLKKVLRCLREIIRVVYPDFKMFNFIFKNKGFFQRQFLTQDDLWSILNELPSKYRDFGVVSAYTGLRLSDVKNLTWSKINVKQLMIHTVMGKTERNLRIPISREVLKVLNKKNKVRPIGDCFLFTFSTITFQHQWKKAREKAGFNWARPHDLRHFFCSYLLNNGVDHMTVATLSGHRTVSILKERYGHLSDPTLSRAIGVFDIVPSLSANVIK